MNLELNQFRDVDIVLDKANDNFIQKQFVSAGDKEGRSLTVQITENGAVGEVIGLTLNLRWHNEASGLTDLSAFYVVDRATSVFKIDYPQNMLTPGKVIAYIQILHGGKVTHTKPFEITVQKLAGTTKGVLATAEYGALVTTLAKANEFSAQLAQKPNFTDVRKNTDDKPINVSEFDTETKTLLLDAGGNVAVVGEKAVGNENLKYRAVKPVNTSFIEDSNVLIEHELVDRTLIQADGTTIVSGGYHSFIDIPLKNGEEYQFIDNDTQQVLDVRAVLFYNADGTISRLLNNTPIIKTLGLENKVSFSFSQEYTNVGLKIKGSAAGTLKNIEVDASNVKNTKDRFGIEDVNFIKKPIDFLADVNPTATYINVDGTLISSGGYVTFENIPINSTITYNLLVNNGGFARNIVFFTEEKVKTRNIEYFSGTFTPFENEKLISFSILKENGAKLFNKREEHPMLNGVKIQESDILKSDSSSDSDKSFAPFYGKGRKPIITFILDGEYNMNDTMEQTFFSKGVKIGFAPQYTTNWSNNPVTKYLEWQTKGHEILSHASTVLNDGASQSLEEADTIIKNSYEILTSKGFDIKGLIGSSGFIADRYMPSVRRYYQYGATLANLNGGALKPYLTFRETPPYRMYRYSLELSTLAEMKHAVDETIQNDGFLIFYGHAKIENDNNFTVANIEALLSYIQGKGVDILTPYEAVSDYYAIRYEDLMPV